MGSLDEPSSPPSYLAQPWTETPLIPSAALSRASSCDVHLKLENLQPSGSFKSRGVGNLILQRLLADTGSVADALDASTHTPPRPRPHFYISSGGNAGLACVSAARSLDCAATVVVPVTTSPLMIAKIRAAGASDVVQTGASWAEADGYLRETILGQGQDPAARKGKEGREKHGLVKADQEPSSSEERESGKYYVPPFDHPDVWDGNATLVLELASKPDVIICSVGGGGLFCGIMRGLEQRGWLGSVDVVAVETEGAASLRASLDAGRLVTLDKITSLATSLGARTVARRAFEYASMPGAKVTSVVLKDRDAVKGCLEVADEDRFLVEPACGVSAAVCLAEGGGVRRWVPGLKEDSKVVVVLCGGSNVTLDMLTEWKRRFGIS